MTEPQVNEPQVTESQVTESLRIKNDQIPIFGFQSLGLVLVGILSLHLLKFSLK
jgi:hypothetical protein